MVNVSRTVQILPKTKVISTHKRKRVGILGGTFLSLIHI